MEDKIKELASDLSRLQIRNERINIPRNAVNVVTSSMEVFIPFEDLVDIKEEIDNSGSNF